MQRSSPSCRHKHSGSTSIHCFTFEPDAVYNRNVEQSPRSGKMEFADQQHLPIMSVDD